MAINLVIGLGGVGKSVMYEYFLRANRAGALVPVNGLEIISIDSEPANDDKASALNNHGHFFCIGGSSINQAIMYIFVKNDFELFHKFPGYKIPKGHMWSGCSAVRYNGRFCSYANTRNDVHGGLLTVLKAKLDNLKAYGEDKVEHFSRGDGGEPIMVHIVSSLVGGTGTGLFLEIAQLLRLVKPQAVELGIYGYLITPNHAGLNSVALNA